ncbi:MAG: alpha/beta hydrolase family protein [Kiritimatiellae bacterium]|nr:alpha/beta hydrolase family protein [Kiritimatiellia bacterium]
MKLTPTLCIVAACASTAAMGEPPQAGLARQPRKTSMSDFTPERPDGRSAKAYTWAMLELRDRMRAKHEELKEKFRRLDVRRRDGYTVETWEFYPDDILAVKAMFLIPDKATAFVTPVTVCIATNEASVEGLSGEEDPYGVKCAPLALNAVRKGEIAVALALPGCANGAPDDLKSADSRKRYIAYLQDTDWTDAKLIELEKRMCLDFLRGRTDFPVSH